MTEREEIDAGELRPVGIDADGEVKPAEELAEPVEKFPELRAAFDRLQSEADAIERRSLLLREERDGIAEDIKPHLDRIRELNEEIRSVEGTRLAELKNQIGALARAMGGRSMSQSSESEQK
jgi:uncharacterized coiled-coil DUF342 family protein